MADTGEPQPATAAPCDGQKIIHNGRTYTTVKEGLAYILIPPNQPQSTDPKKKHSKEDDNQKQSVFYNPIQQFNRDLSVLAIKAYGEDVVQVRKLNATNRLARTRKRNEKWKERSKKQSRKTEDTTEPSMQGSPHARNADNTDTASIQVQQEEHAAGSADSNELSEAQRASVNGGEEEDINDGAEDGRGMKRKREHGTREPLDEQVTKKQFTTSEGQMEEIAATETVAVTEPQADLEDGGIDDAELLALDLQPGPTISTNFRILDALSATGLRAVRYAHEIPFATSITANDLSAKATEMINLNIQHNNLTSKITAVTGNAIAHMYSFTGQENIGGPGHKYDVIDLDPYGTAAPFLDAAVQAVNDGGLLCVTCTDAGVFASSGYSEKTFSQYGGLPLKGHHSHEAGLRLILHSIAMSAARYGVAIEPLLSLSIDYYARVFVRVKKSPAEVKFLSGKTMLVYNCDSGCGAWTTQLLGRNSPHKGKKGEMNWKYGVSQGPSASENCQHCGFKTHIAGPMYAGPIHNTAYVERILSYLPSLDKSVYGTIERIRGMLNNVLEEASIMDVPMKPHPLTLKSVQTSTENSKALDSPKAPELNLLPHVDPASIDNHPFFIKPDYLARVLHCSAPSEASVKGALRHLGFRAVRTHIKPGMVKTDAPWPVIWRVMREWVRQRAPVKEGKITENMPGWKIMQVQDAIQDEVNNTNGSTTADKTAEEVNGNHDAIRKTGLGKVIFDEKLGKKDDKKGLVRYQMNPRANWGPMTRAK